MQIIFQEEKREVATALYQTFQKANIPAILDDRDGLSIGNRIQDVFFLGTPKIIVLGNKYQEGIYEVEDARTNRKEMVQQNEIIEYFKFLKD